MKRYIINLLTNQRGPKEFYSNKERLIVHYSPLNQFESFKEKIERTFKNEGIYLLFGQNEDGEEKVYIGESDNVERRIKHHLDDKNKSFIEEVVIISSYTQDYLSKDELHYIEKKLIRLFKASSFIVDNNNDGQGKELKSFDKLQINDDLEFILLALESFGIKITNPDVIANKENKGTINTNDSRRDIEIYCEKYKTKEKIYGILHPDNSVTIRGGQLLEIEKARSKDANRKLIMTAIGYLENIDSAEFIGNIDSYQINFKEDTWFRSPSGASVPIRAGSSNGWLDWKTSDGKSIDKFRK